jgi:hypothetical protein
MSASELRGQDVERAPAQLLVRRSPYAPLGALVLAVASVWLAVAVRGAVAGNPAIVPGLGSSGAYCAGAVGAALAVLGLHWALRRRTVVVDRGALLVTERSLFGGRRWREPLANYREIRGRIEQRPHRYGPRRWHVVMLWHPEPARTIELARARDPAAARSRAQEYARRFGLPLVWEQAPTIMAAPAAAPAADRPGQEVPAAEVAAPAVPGQSLSAS